MVHWELDWSCLQMALARDEELQFPWPSPSSFTYIQHHSFPVLQTHKSLDLNLWEAFHLFLWQTDFVSVMLKYHRLIYYSTNKIHRSLMNQRSKDKETWAMIRNTRIAYMKIFCWFFFFQLGTYIFVGYHHIAIGLVLSMPQNWKYSCGLKLFVEMLRNV